MNNLWVLENEVHKVFQNLKMFQSQYDVNFGLVIRETRVFRVMCCLPKWVSLNYLFQRTQTSYFCGGKNNLSQNGNRDNGNSSFNWRKGRFLSVTLDFVN